MRVPNTRPEEIRAKVLATHREARERSLRAAQAIARGEIQVPLRCGDCRTPSVTQDDDDERFLRCLQCSRTTRLSTAHQLRRQEIRMIIAAGVDPRPNRRGS